ncbi:MAG: hypothetical protein E6G31_09025, partial [Actinobacteria bacterium]
MRAKLFYRLLLMSGLGLALIGGAVFMPHSASSRSPVSNPVLRQALDGELGRVPRNTGAPAISSGVMYSLLDQTGTLRRRGDRTGFHPRGVEITGTEGCRNEFTGG